MAADEYASLMKAARARFEDILVNLTPLEVDRRVRRTIAAFDLFDKYRGAEKEFSRKVVEVKDIDAFLFNTFFKELKALRIFRKAEIFAKILFLFRFYLFYKWYEMIPKWFLGWYLGEIRKGKGGWEVLD